MKKMMMMMIAAVIVAMTSQAVGVAWSVAGLTSSDQIGGTGYLFNTGTVTADSIRELLSAGNKDGAIAKAWGNSGTVSDKGMINVAAASSGITIDYAGETITETAFAVIFSADGSQFAVTGEKTQTFTSNTGSKTFAFGNVANSVTWATVGGDTPTPPPIPEPTSMALLAMGVAAFGLRRKFRK